MSRSDANPTIEPLLRDLVAWVAREPRSYVDTMEAWRTSCPRLPVWEEANDRGLIVRKRQADGSILMVTTAKGRALLA